MYKRWYNPIDSWSSDNDIYIYVAYNQRKHIALIDYNDTSDICFIVTCFQNYEEMLPPITLSKSDFLPSSQWVSLQYLFHLISIIDVAKRPTQRDPQCDIH